MGRRNEATCPKGRRHRSRQRLRQGEDFRAGLGHRGPVASDDRDPARAGQERRRAFGEEARSFGLPIVTSAITHGLSLVGDLFVDPGDRIVLPDKLWGNYRLTYEVRLGAEIETFPTYRGESLNTRAFARLLCEGPDKVIALLNFPNNPTGYMPTRDEVERLRDGVIEAAHRGKRIVLVLDEAYYGLVFDDDALQESLLGFFANIHPAVLTIKLDGATKELFAWGLRCGFLTYAPPPVDDPHPLLEALEQKTMGAIRGDISNCSHVSQSLVLGALQAPELAAERREKLGLLKRRAAKVAEVVRHKVYRDSWEVYPFNAGYFMCIRVKGVDAERLRVHLLENHGIGLISIGATDLRVAFSCLEESEIEPLFACVHQAIQELSS